MVELFTICNIWHGLSKVPGKDLTETPRVVKCVEVDEKFVMGGVLHCCGDCRHCLNALSACAIDYVATLPTFTVVLSIEDE